MLCRTTVCGATLSSNTLWRLLGAGPDARSVLLGKSSWRAILGGAQACQDGASLSDSTFWLIQRELLTIGVSNRSRGRFAGNCACVASGAKRCLRFCWGGFCGTGFKSRGFFLAVSRAVSLCSASVLHFWQPVATVHLTRSARACEGGGVTAVTLDSSPTS